MTQIRDANDEDIHVGDYIIHSEGYGNSSNQLCYGMVVEIPVKGRYKLIIVQKPADGGKFWGNGVRRYSCPDTVARTTIVIPANLVPNGIRQKLIDQEQKYRND